MRLDIDPKSHPAWTGQQRMMDTGGQIAKFNKSSPASALQEEGSGPRRRSASAARLLRGGAPLRVRGS